MVLTFSVIDMSIIFLKSCFERALLPVVLCIIDDMNFLIFSFDEEEVAHCHTDPIYKSWNFTQAEA